MPVVRRHEHDQWHRIDADLLDHFESCPAAKLHVQKHHVRALRDDGGDRVVAAAALADTGHARNPVEFAPQASPGKRFVIDNQDAHAATGSSGMTTSTQPPDWPEMAEASVRSSVAAPP